MAWLDRRLIMKVMLFACMYGCSVISVNKMYVTIMAII